MKCFYCKSDILTKPVNLRNCFFCTVAHLQASNAKKQRILEEKALARSKSRESTQEDFELRQLLAASGLLPKTF